MGRKVDDEYRTRAQRYYWRHKERIAQRKKEQIDNMSPEERKVYLEKRRENRNVEQQKQYSKKYREENDQKIKETKKKRYLTDEHREKQREKKKLARVESPEKVRQEEAKRRKKRTPEQIQKHKEYAKQHRLDNIERYKELAKINYLKRKESEEYIEKRRNYDKKRRQDARNRILSNLRGRLRSALFNQSAKKANRTIELIGCSQTFLIAHLEKQFTEGMLWANYGKWHVDHIMPCSKFDLTDPEQQKLCFHYSNLQPLWAEDNLSKNGSHPEEWEERKTRTKKKHDS